MGPTNEEEATSKKPISIEINNNKKKKKKKRRSQLPPPPPPPPNIDGRNSYPWREKKDTTMTSSCSCSRVQETVIEDERIVQQISNLSLDTKLKDDHHQRRRVFHDYIGDVAKTREASTPKKVKIRLIKGGEETRRDCNYNDNNHQVESKCVDTKSSLLIVKESGRCEEKVDDEDDDLTSCLSASGWKVKGRRSVDTSSLELKKLVVETEFDSEMLEAAESLLMLRYGRPCSSSMVMMEEEDSRSNINRNFTFDLNHPPPTTPEDMMSL